MLPAGVMSMVTALCRWLPVSMGNRVTACVVRCVRVSGMCVAGMAVTGVTVRITMTVSMATQATNRHPCQANSAKRECGEIYVH